MCGVCRCGGVATRGGAWWRRRGCSVANVNADGAAEDGAGGRSAAASLSHRGLTPLKYHLLHFSRDLCLIYTQTSFPFLFSPLSIHFTADIFAHLSVTHRLWLSVSGGEKSKHNHAENRPGKKKTYIREVSVAHVLCGAALPLLRPIWMKTITVRFVFPSPHIGFLSQPVCRGCMDACVCVSQGGTRRCSRTRMLCVDCFSCIHLFIFFFLLFADLNRKKTTKKNNQSGLSWFKNLTLKEQFWEEEKKHSGEKESVCSCTETCFETLKSRCKKNKPADLSCMHLSVRLSDVFDVFEVAVSISVPVGSL